MREEEEKEEEEEEEEEEEGDEEGDRQKRWRKLRGNSWQEVPDFIFAPSTQED